MKKIFAILMAAVMVLSLSVAVMADWATGPLTLDNFGTSGWDSEYDAATHTISFSGAWTGRGWWIDGDTSLTDGYDAIKVTFPNGAEGAGQIVVQHGDVNDTVPFAAGDAEVVAPFPSDPITQIYIQIGNDPVSLTIGEVTMQVAGTGAAAEAPAAEAEAEAPAAEAEAPAAEAEAPAASTETKAPATGLALAVVPAIVAMAAVAVSKKH